MDWPLIFVSCGWVFWQSMYLWTRRKLNKLRGKYITHLQVYNDLLEAFMVACYSYDMAKIRDVRQDLKWLVGELQGKANEGDSLRWEKASQEFQAKERQAALFERRLKHVGD